MSFTILYSQNQLRDDFIVDGAWVLHAIMTIVFFDKLLKICVRFNMRPNKPLWAFCKIFGQCLLIYWMVKFVNQWFNMTLGISYAS